jgi:DNA-binding transcriptional LysR family regulator
MFLTQSVVSRQIQSLEEELGVTLFIRERKRIYMTPAGAVMYERLAHIYSSLEGLICDIQAIEKGSAGKLVLGIGEGHYLSDQLNPAVRWFTERSSKLHLSIRLFSTNDLVSALFTSDIDIAVTVLPDLVTYPEINTFELDEDKIYLGCRVDHPALKKEEPKLSDFSNDLFFCFPEETSRHMSSLIIKACKQAGFTPQLKICQEWEKCLSGSKWVSACVRQLSCMLINNRSSLS